jgi:hypothetical protein
MDTGLTHRAISSVDFAHSGVGHVGPTGYSEAVHLEATHRTGLGSFRNLAPWRVWG